MRNDTWPTPRQFTNVNQKVKGIPNNEPEKITTDRSFVGETTLINTKAVNDNTNAQ